MSISMDRAERVIENAEFIETCLGILVEKQTLSHEEYAHDMESRDIVERRFVKMTQACIDIARMLLVEVGVEIPDANSGAMHGLAEVGVISASTAQGMADACAFRNVLSHRYGNVIDDGIVFDALQDLTRYREFLVEIRAFLTEDGAI